MGPDLARDRLRAGQSTGSIPDTVRFSFLLFVFSFPFEFLELPYITGGHFSLANLTGLLFFGFYLFHLRIPFTKSIPTIPPAIFCFLGYVLTYAMGSLYMDEELGLSYFVRFTTIVQLIVFLWCASNLLKDERLAKACLLTFAAGAVILAVGSLLSLPGFVPEIRTRARPLGMNPNRVASLMVCAAIILIGFCLNESRWSLKRKWLVLILALPLMLLLVSTGSRSGIGGFIIGISIFVLARGGLKRKVVATLLSVLGGAVVLFLVAGDPLASQRWERFFQEGHTTGRDEIFSAALEVISEKPLFGWGRSGLDELGLRLGQGRTDAHNFILYLLLEVGVIGTLPFLIGVFLCVLAAWKARKSPIGILPLALLLALLAMMMTHTGLTAKSFWLFLALSLGASAVTRRAAIRTSAVPNQKFTIPRRADVLRP